MTKPYSVNDYQRKCEQLQAELDRYKQKSSDLNAQLAKINAITENALTWIWETDAHGKYTAVGLAVEQILGYRP